MFVREFDGRALVWFLLLGVVFDLGERDLETDADHLELDGLDDRDNGVDDVELDNRSPGETPRLSRRGGVLHAKIWREAIVRAREADGWTLEHGRLGWVSSASAVTKGPKNEPLSLGTPSSLAFGAASTT